MFFIVLGVLAVLIIPTTFFIVKPLEMATVTRLGRYVRTGHSGFNVKLPWPLESVDRRLTLAICEADQDIRVKTSDNAYVDMPITIFFRANPEMAFEAAYRLEDHEVQIMQLAAKEIRSIATDMTMDELFKDKDEMERAVTEELENFVTENGFILERIVIDEPSPSEEIQRASNNVQASAKALEAAKNEAEGIRIRRVGEAKADAEALECRAEAYAKSRKIIAGGMLDASKVIGDIGLSQTEIISVLEGVDWRDALISCSKGPGTIIVDSRGGASEVGKIVGLIKSQNEKGAQNNEV